MLYNQLATLIRYRIASGELRAGDRLPSLREAATAWDVSLHTVRHAYHVLAEEGLLEVPDRKRPRVLSHRKANSAPSAANRSLQEFALWAVEAAWQQFRVPPWELARMIETAPEVTTIVVVECTRVLSDHLAKQLQRELGAAVTPKTLNDALPLDGLVIGTYYHYQEIAKRMGSHPGVLFLTLEVDPECIAAIRARMGKGKSMVLCGPDAASLEAMATDLRRHFAADVNIHAIVSRRPSQIINAEDRKTPIVLTPEAWEAVSRLKRNLDNVVPHLSRFTKEALREAREHRAAGLGVKPGSLRRAHR